MFVTGRTVACLRAETWYICSGFLSETY